jgi:multidrug efflux pump subunit AcrA (membrane-fusion protein)
MSADKKIRNLWICGIGLALIVMTYSCSGKPQDATVPEKNPLAVSVKIAPVIADTIVQQIEVVGETVAAFKIDVYPKINGAVISKEIQSGSSVRAGQLLATIRQDIPGMEFSIGRVEAPCGGFITFDGVEVGSTVHTQRILFTISSFSPLVVQAQIPEEFLAQIRIGLPAEVEFEAFPAHKMKAAVFEINPLLNTLSRSLPVKLRLSGSIPQAKSGLFARIRFTTGAHPGVTIPLDAVIRAGAERYVFCIRNDKAEKRMITTGEIVGKRQEVRSGLQAGDKVVVLGQNMLDEGVAVRLEE